MPLVHAFDPPERFVVGTVGPPGARTFFLQARDGARITSVALEKQQVEALSERVDELLDEVMRAEDNTALIPAVAPFDLIDNEPARAADRGGVPRRHDDAVVGPRDRAHRDRGLPVHRGGRRLARSSSTRTSRSPSPTRSSWSGYGRRRPGLRRPGPHRGRRGPSRLPVLRQPDRPRRPPVRAGQRLPPPRPAAAVTDPLDGELTLHGRVMPASNATFVGEIDGLRVVYKPIAGERPLWDFPDGTLAGREVAAYLGQRGAGLEHRPAHDPARRAARPGHGAGLAGARPGAGARSTSCPPVARPRASGTSSTASTHATARSRSSTRTRLRCG